MYDLLIKNALLCNGSLSDIAIENGKIAALGQIHETAAKVVDLAGRYRASAGWIDSHVHCYPASPIYFDEPDRVGIDAGVTTVVDAGSTGADDIADFDRLRQSSKTNVLALLNISRIGLAVQNELADLQNIDAVLASQAIRRHRGFVIGLKARLSSSVVGSNGLQPLSVAKAIQQKHGSLPLMVHVGNTPPDLGEIADLLDAGDILTHCYNGKPNRILDQDGQIRSQILQAIERGVLLDVGHGSSSFSFQVAHAALAQGILPYTISSDIYCRNRIKGPVFALAHVMSKFFTLGLSLEQVIDCVTLHAATALQLPAKGRLEAGMDGDLTLFDIRNTPCLFTDCEGGNETGEKQLIPLAAVVAGELFLLEEGKKTDVFNL